MAPWKIAKQWQEENDATLDFDQLVTWHLANGLVFSNAGSFLVAKELHCNFDDKTLSDTEPRNCWFVRLAASTDGKLSEFMRVAPYPHEYVAWHRRGGSELKIHRWETVARKLR